jgi:superfamily II DNA or RNA helicase
MTSLVKLAHNAVTAKIFTDDAAVKSLVADSLSYYVEGAEYMAAFKGRHWDGRSSFFSRRTSTFPAGFAPLIHDKLVSAGYRAQLVRAPLPEALGYDLATLDNFDGRGGDERYDFQLESIRQIDRHGRGIIQCATGSGKSRIAQMIMGRYKRMTLFLTTRGVLMYQMKDACEEVGFRVGVIGDGVFSPVKGVNVCMVQTLVAHLKETTLEAERLALIGQIVARGESLDPKALQAMAQEQLTLKQRRRARIIQLLELFEVVIGEEAHEAGGNSYFEILRHCKNAHIRVALTATPFMRDDAEDNMRLMAAFGPVLIQVSEEMLIDRGILAEPFFKYVSYTPHPKLRKTSPWQRAYQLGIQECEDRNRQIVEHARKAIEHGLPVMILVQRTAHGKLLKELLDPHGKTVFIRGENDQNERKHALDRLKDGRVKVLIGTTILDVGVDVPAVGMVILAGGGKAEVALRQRIGRGLRAKKAGPNICFVVDFDDGLNLHLREHARQRRSIVEATSGFNNRILKPGEDFAWHRFSKSSAA